MIEPPRIGISPVVAPVAESWHLIDGWLAKHAPASRAALRPPASHQAIDRAEERLGFTLPPDLRESLRCHDGDTSHFGVLPCDPLYSTQQIVETRNGRMSIWDADDPDQLDEPWWGTLWVPFAGSDGDEHFIDAGPGRWHNQLGHAAHDDSAHFLGWPSLAVWLHCVAQAMVHHDDHGRIEPVHPPLLPGDGTVGW
ncbi:SMI1/KNR4 family protein [Kitasatospora viridis]|uniref:Cell wall assembly regulator SMI1 n=1 Tax=Kitasatospora viridis TaxID=281105 RepID=A0A561S9Q8_9ACTN|nr:SMI1/KNR4 family protein [Kitasatospora viridis]TWF71603.1 cell wall assembly regulator SMI1 [Kitasatospora viridis]